MKDQMALTAPPHGQTVETCLSYLQARTEGLSDVEAAQRLKQYGPNRLPEIRTRGPVRRFPA